MTAAPDLIWLFAALIVGFTLGLIPALLLRKNRMESAKLSGRQELATDLATLEERLTSREEQLQRQSVEIKTQSGQLEKLIEEKASLGRENTRLNTELKEEVRRSDERLKVLNDTRKEMQVQFENLANQILLVETT